MDFNVNYRFRENTLAYTLLTVFPLSRYFPFMQKSMKSLNDGILFGNGEQWLVIQGVKLVETGKEVRSMLTRIQFLGMSNHENGC